MRRRNHACYPHLRQIRRFDRFFFSIDSITGNEKITHDSSTKLAVSCIMEGCKSNDEDLTLRKILKCHSLYSTILRGE